LYSDIQHNWHASLVDVYKIKEYVEDNNGEVDDKLKEIAEALDDDDNPVLEITKFK
jgi:predicted DNA-binding ArsR family transcriptional regulator